jgi:hypothetical protein
LSTFGVTEACVDQTNGPVFMTTITRLDKMLDLFFSEWKQFVLVDVKSKGTPGEVVLFGNQLDELSSSLNRPELRKRKFLYEEGRYYYRTGDRG